MRQRTTLSAFVLALLISGCVPSLHPLHTNGNLVFEAALLGTWVEKEEQSIWIFHSSDQQSYHLTFRQRTAGFQDSQPGEPAEFEATLVRIGSALYLDTSPVDLSPLKNDFYNFHLIQSHIFSRIWIEDETVRIALLNADWFEDKFAQGELDIAAESVNGNIVLTASTSALQKFFEQQAEEKELFTEPVELTRR